MQRQMKMQSQEIFIVPNKIVFTDEMFDSKNYFSAGKQSQQSALCGVQEGQVIGEKGQEMRKQVTSFVDQTFLTVQGQICSKFESKCFVGSGTICIFGTSWQSYYFLLTCAHNLIQILSGIAYKVVQPSAIEYRYSQLNRETYFLKSKVKSFAIYPGYKENYQIHKGYDIGFALLDGDFSNAPISKNSCWSNIDKENPKAGESILVIGYPGEYDGQLFLMQGTIKEIVKLSEDRKIILYNNLNTSGGQSGSPIYLVRNGRFIIIGVHVGYDPSEQVNVGTALTEKVMDWISETYLQLVSES